MSPAGSSCQAGAGHTPRATALSAEHRASSAQSGSLPEMPEIVTAKPGVESQADEDFSVAQYPSAEVHGKERMMVISGIADENLLTIDAPNLLFEKTKDPEHEGVHHVQFFPQDEAYSVCVRYNNVEVEGGSFRLIPGRMQREFSQNVSVNIPRDDFDAYNADDEGEFDSDDDSAEKRRANALWRIPIPFTGIAFEFGFTSMFSSPSSAPMAKRKYRTRRRQRQQPFAGNSQTSQEQTSAAHTSVGTQAMESSQAPAASINTRSAHSTPRRFYSSASGEEQPRVVVHKDPDMLGPRYNDEDDEVSRLLTHKDFAAVDEDEFDAEQHDIEELGVDILEA